METPLAMRLAEEKGLDLVEINPSARPPVCRIMDYGRHKYELSKKEKERKSKQRDNELKEIRLTAKIGDHDLSYKARQAREFFDKGHKIKVSMRLRGRENAFVDNAFKVFEKFTEYSGLKYENRPSKSGSIIIANVSGLTEKGVQDAKIENPQSNS